MRVFLNTTFAHPDHGAFAAGKIHNLPDDIALDLVASGGAFELDAKDKPIRTAKKFEAATAKKGERAALNSK